MPGGFWDRHASTILSSAIVCALVVGFLVSSRFENCGIIMIALAICSAALSMVLQNSMVSKILTGSSSAFD
jgi:hypothetical protein